MKVRYIDITDQRGLEEYIIRNNGTYIRAGGKSISDLHRLANKSGATLICDLHRFRRLIGDHQPRYPIILNDGWDVTELFMRCLVTPNEAPNTKHEWWSAFHHRKFPTFSHIRDRILRLDLVVWTDSVVGDFLSSQYPNVKFIHKSHPIFQTYDRYGFIQYSEDTTDNHKDRVFSYTINFRSDRLARSDLGRALGRSGLMPCSLSLNRSIADVNDLQTEFRKDLMDSYKADQVHGVDWLDGMPKRSFYRRTFVELVAEGFGNIDGDDTFWLTEKSIKPIVMRHPFVTMAPVNHLANMRKMGFRTFGDLIDESYDAMPTIKDRINVILENLRMIGEDPQKFWHQTRPIADHNFETLKRLLVGSRDHSLDFGKLLADD